MNELTVSLSDLGMIILWAALLVLIIYLTLVLKNLYGTLKEVQEVLSTNRENIDNTLAQVPSIAQNIEEITGEVSHDVQTVRGTLDAIAHKSEIAAASIDDTGDIITGIASVIQVGMFIKNISSSVLGKKRRVL